jgi:bisphosphoglycerate-independent phosphoglycerate mutase (AlkP superfamily)
MGNSKVNHNALGAGRIFSQEVKMADYVLASWEDMLKAGHNI